MPLSPLVNTLIGAIIGVVITTIAKQLELFGKIALVHKKAELHYRKLGDYKFLVRFVLHIQMANTSGKDKIVSNIEAQFIKQNTKSPLSIEDHPLPPAFTVAAKKAVTQSYTLRLPVGLNHSLYADDDYALLITYRVGTRTKSFTIAKDDLAELELKLPHTN